MVQKDDFVSPPMDDSLRPYMSETDYTFFCYIMWLDDVYSQACEIDPNAVPHSDLLDAEKLKKFRELSIIKTSVMIARFDTLYPLMPYLNPKHWNNN